MAFDYDYNQKMKTIRSDPDNKFNFHGNNYKNVSRQKKKTDSGKGIQLQGRSGAGRVSDESIKGREKQKAAINAGVNRLFRNTTDEQREKAKKQAQKRREQQHRDNVNGIYRENYMSPEAYDHYMEMAFGNKKGGK